VPTSSARYATELTRVICARASASRLRTSNYRDPEPETKASNAAMCRVHKAMSRSCFARKRSLYQSARQHGFPREHLAHPRVLLLGEARRQDFLLLVLHVLNSLADFFHVLRALVEGENPVGGAEALVVTNLRKRLQQVEVVQNQGLQLVDAGLLAGVVGSQLPERFEPVAGLGQACGVRNQIGLLVRHEEPAQLCFGLGDACRGGFELREDVVGVSHPAGISTNFVEAR
jgi:hypothetical protein